MMLLRPARTSSTCPLQSQRLRRRKYEVDGEGESPELVEVCGVGVAKLEVAATVEVLRAVELLKLTDFAADEDEAVTVHAMEGEEK
jgi:hypothetical protein